MAAWCADIIGMRALLRRSLGASVLELAGVCMVLGLVAASQTTRVQAVIQDAITLKIAANAVNEAKNGEVAQFGYSNVWSGQTVTLPPPGTATTNLLNSEIQAVTNAATQLNVHGNANSYNNP
jgi:urea transporter